MMKHIIIICSLLIFSSIKSQNKKDWYFLAETGFNKVISSNEIHFGVGVEYFISTSTSFTFRLKYFKNGIDYYKEGSSCGFAGFFCSSSKEFLYKGSVLKIPINYKWEKALFSSKFNFFFTSGMALNFTLKDNFIKTKGLTPNETKVNLNFNLGLGFLYKINASTDIYTKAETYSGNPKTKEKVGFIFGSRLRTEESLINFGIRFKLK